MNIKGSYKLVPLMILAALAGLLYCLSIFLLRNGWSHDLVRVLAEALVVAFVVSVVVEPRLLKASGTGPVSAGRRTSLRDAISSFIVLVIIGGTAAGLVVTRSPVTPINQAPQFERAGGCAGAKPSAAAKVADAAAPLNIFIGRDGSSKERQSAPLAVQTGSLCPGEILTASVSDIVRGDGASLGVGQVTAWGQADTTGTHVSVYVAVAPRYKQVSGSGGYSGVVSLADPRATGGNVAVNVHVLYPWVPVVFAFSCLAAFGGFIWAWLVHVLNSARREDDHSGEYFWRNFILRVAVIVAATVPVVNAQFLANPDWEGTLSQYITLATLSGAAAIALTPTFRVLALPPSLPTHGHDRKPAD
jgi:hypothetical protein